MNKQQILFEVGDRVIHWLYGPGLIIDLDEKRLSGHTRLYYVVETKELTLWAPVDQTDEHILRLPTPKKDFNDLFKILGSPGESLSNDRNERRLQLIERLKDRKLSSICRVVRDLTFHKRLRKMNDNDNSTLERSWNFLINEWSVSLSIPVAQAERELRKLLQSDEII